MSDHDPSHDPGSGQPTPGGSPPDGGPGPTGSAGAGSSPATSSGSSAGGSSVGGSSAGGSGWQRWSVVLPALTFVVGLLVGGAVIGIASTGDDGPAGPVAEASPTPTPTASPSPAETDLVVTVPAPCVQAAEKAEVAFDLLDQGAQAISELDARRLQELVDRAQDERPEVQALVEQCRSLVGSQIVEPAESPPAPPSPTS